jgi:hypothetical protein
MAPGRGPFDIHSVRNPPRTRLVITFGIFSGVVVAALVVVVILAARRGRLERTYRWLAWLPVSALLIEIALAKPALSALSYAAILPPLVTCLFSLVLAVVGATLVAAARQRNEPAASLIRATIVAGIPGMLLVGYMVIGFVVAKR